MGRSLRAVAPPVSSGTDPSTPVAPYSAAPLDSVADRHKYTQRFIHVN